MKIGINISQFQNDVLAHNQSSVGLFIQGLATRAADVEAIRLADREIRDALDDPKKNPTLTMDREAIVKAKFAAPDYKNAAARLADQEKAQKALEKAQKAARQA